MDGASAFDEPSDARGGSARATILLSFGLVANLATQMTFAAALHEIAAAWSLDAGQSGWIGGIYFAGYTGASPAYSVKRWMQPSATPRGQWPLPPRSNNRSSPSRAARKPLPRICV
jgi:hypothetical protein